jgi:hypothetical protein
MLLAYLRKASWLSTVLRVLVLCFALGTLAHAGHTHELSTASDSHYNCDYCTAFGGLIDTPVTPDASPLEPVISETLRLPDQPAIITRAVSVAQARAPPYC